MKKEEITSILKKINLKMEEYYMAGDSSLVFRGIKKECSKLDLCMTPVAFEKLKSYYAVNFVEKQSEKNTCLPEYINILIKEKQEFDCEVVNHCSLENVEVILQRKRQKNLKEEKMDIIKIENYIRDLKHEICCGGYVIDNGKILVVQHNKGHWDFPKGHMEKNETEEETAKREVLEETGIAIEIVSNKKYEIEYKPKMNVQKRVIFFEAKKVGGELQKQESEVCNVEWVEKEKILEKLTFERSRETFKKFMKDKGWI